MSQQSSETGALNESAIDQSTETLKREVVVNGGTSLRKVEAPTRSDVEQLYCDILLPLTPLLHEHVETEREMKFLPDVKIGREGYKWYHIPFYERAQ